MPRKKTPSEFVLRVPAPMRLLRGRSPPGYGAREAVAHLQDMDDDDDLIRKGEVLSLRIPVIEPAAAPIAFAVGWGARPEYDEHEPDEYGSYRSEVRLIDGGLFARYWLSGRKIYPDISEPEHTEVGGLRTLAHNMCMGINLFLDNPFLQPHVGGYEPAKSLRDIGSVGTDLFRGPSPSEIAVRSAARDFVLIGGRLHRRVGDPVLASVSAGRGERRGLFMLLPTIPELDGLRRFRYDRADEAEAFFAEDGEVGGGARYGRMFRIDPAYVPTRDDDRMAAIDAGRIYLRSTSRFFGYPNQMSARLMRGWAELRDDLVALEAGGDIVDFMDRADGFAELCGHKTDGLNASDDAQKAAAGVVSRTRKLAQRRRRQLQPEGGPTP